MRSDVVLRGEGMQILAEQLGLVEAERFVTLLRRDSFDYTQWQQDLFKDMPLDEFLTKANDFRKGSKE